MEPDPDEHQHPGEEDLEWVDETVKGKKPKGLYSRTSETARGFISTERQCALFCGGKKCKYCIGEGWAEDEMAIKGLYSHWVTENILAMARPTNHGIEKYNLVQKFMDEGINSIINLQTKGEHGECGPEKLDDSGFSYNPQIFMEKGIFFYNFGCPRDFISHQRPDYGVANLSTILDMVKVMQFAVTQGKMAVHCHAGRGRTGVIIACYLVFTNRISGIDAIHYIRDKRPNSIQTRRQMQVIQEFEQYLKPFRTVFASREPGSHEFTLQQFLNRQRHILHGYEARRLKYVPKIIYVVCERLLELAKKGSSLQKQLEKSNSDLRINCLKQTITNGVQSTGSITVSKSASKESLENLGRKKRYKASLLATRNRFKSISMEDLDNDKFKEVLDDQERASIASSGSGVTFKAVPSDNEEDDDDDASIVFGNSTINLKAVADKNGHSEIDTNGAKQTGCSNNTDQSAHQSTKNQTGSSKMLDNVSLQSEGTTCSSDQSMSGQMSEEAVHQVTYALSARDIEHYVLDRAEIYEKQLNETETAWTSLAVEGDPYVLAQILWDWLDQLKEPVLTVQDLQNILKHIDQPDVGLCKVEKGTKSIIEYLVKVIGKLIPVNEDTLSNMYEKLLSHLTHQWVVYEDIDLTKSWAGSTVSSLAEEKEHWSEMRPDVATKLFRLVHNIQHQLKRSNNS